MKYWRIINLAIILCISISCTREYLQTKDGNEYERVVFKARFHNNSSKTTVSPEDSTKVLWCPGDEISVFTPWETNLVFKNIDSAESQVASFDGYMRRIIGGLETVPKKSVCYAVYPYSNENSMVEDSVFVLTLKENQIAKRGTFDCSSFPSIAKSNAHDLEFSFFNVCGGLSFTLKDGYIKTVKIKSTTGTLSGRCKVCFTKNEGNYARPEIVSWEKASSTVKLTAPGDSVFTKDTKYYISLPPCTLSAGDTIEFIRDSSGIRSKGYRILKKDAEIERTKFLNAFHIDEGVMFEISVTSVELDRENVVIEQKDSITLNATVNPTEVKDKKILWTSTDTSVVQVDTNGKVTAINEGVAYIKATSHSDESISDSCKFTVHHETWNLSVNGNANCYICPKSGKYKFRLCKGIQDEITIEADTAVRIWQFESVEASLKNTIIDSVYIDKNEGWVYFKVPEPIKEGSASIAAEDKDGNILWSWHIWVAEDYYPENEKQEYKDTLGKTVGFVMNRNLGSGFSICPSVESPGMYYQWGRKDPFPGYFGISIKAVTGAVWPDPLLSSETTGTIDYATKHPMTYIYTKGANYNYDWFYNIKAELDIASVRWKSEEKTDYDPCPPGWRIPGGGSDGIWSQSSCLTGKTTVQGLWSYNETGMNLQDILHTTEDCWYGATGYYYGTAGYLDCNRIIGKYWSSSYDTSKKDAWNFTINRSDEVNPVDKGKCSYGYAIRCVKDE